MPHLIQSTPSTTGPATAGIGIRPALINPTATIAKHLSSPLANETFLSSEAPVPDSNSNSDSSCDLCDDDFSSDSDGMDDSERLFSNEAGQSSEMHGHTSNTNQRPRRHLRRGRDLFSQLPPPILQQILALLHPFQMLTISELSRKFYNFVVLGQEMNEVWFRLVKHEEAEEKKRLDWYKLKKLEQEQRGVQMMRSFSNSSASSTMSTASGYGFEESVTPLSKQAQRLLNKKQEAAGKSTGAIIKAMKRSDRKKNWCKIYVDSILRGNGESPLLALTQVVLGSAKTPSTFQTIVLNEPLPQEHFRDYQGGSSKDQEDENKALSREAKTQAKIEKRMYYKSIRSKPKGKKAGQMDSPAAKVDKVAPWRQPEWSEQDRLDAEDY
ncbi:hypothetical protein EDD11_005066 [Mortierella claussenii]|nr:hypothetical protein EDD11_005066 [Mortierella claussenii]